jgi:hypothetical protein
VLGPLIDAPFDGGPSSWTDDFQLEVQRLRRGDHFTYAYSPVSDDTAPRRIGGVRATVSEITEKIVGAEAPPAARAYRGARMSTRSTMPSGLLPKKGDDRLGWPGGGVTPT